MMASRNKIIIISIFIVLSISSLVTFWMKSKEDSFADEIISEASVSFKNKFK